MAARPPAARLPGTTAVALGLVSGPEEVVVVRVVVLPEPVPSLLHRWPFESFGRRVDAGVEEAGRCSRPAGSRSAFRESTGSVGPEIRRSRA